MVAEFDTALPITSQVPNTDFGVMTPLTVAMKALLLSYQY